MTDMEFNIKEALFLIRGFFDVDWDNLVNFICLQEQIVFINNL